MHALGQQDFRIDGQLFVDAERDAGVGVDRAGFGQSLFQLLGERGDLGIVRLGHRVEGLLVLQHQRLQRRVVSAGRGERRLLAVRRDTGFEDAAQLIDTWALGAHTPDNMFHGIPLRQSVPYCGVSASGRM